jgi:hypothetical protein
MTRDEIIEKIHSCTRNEELLFVMQVIVDSGQLSSLSEIDAHQILLRLRHQSYDNSKQFDDNWSQEINKERIIASLIDSPYLYNKERKEYYTLSEIGKIKHIINRTTERLNDYETS